MRISQFNLLLTNLVLVSCLAQGLEGADCEYFGIRIVDAESGRGVPLVELRTVSNVRYYSDSAGYVAFLEPGLMNQSVYFHVNSHGYEYPKDGLGFRGKRLKTEPGKIVTLKIRRLNAAERLYRVTGSGIYRDSLLLGLPVPIEEPVLNAKVIGSDSVVTAQYRGQIHWFWGDTNRPSYPLGNFHVPGATSDLPWDGGLDPAVGVELSYFKGQDGFAKPTAKMPGKGPTWINGLVVVEDESDHQELLATYVKVQPPLKIYERGIVRFNDERQEFEKIAELDLEAPLLPGGHPIVKETPEGNYVYFGNPFPLTRVAATVESIANTDQYETYTCLATGSRMNSLEVEKRDGHPVFRWRRDTIPYTPKLQEQLIKEGLLDREQALFQLSDSEGKPVLIHSGSVCWNDHRARWIMIGLQSWGSSLLGELWYAESETLTGPWKHARKIVTHDKYSFYNPKQHPYFDAADGRIIYFEGTYTNMFSGNPDRTPRYNYNQIMYSLDLASSRLDLPTPK